MCLNFPMYKVKKLILPTRQVLLSIKEVNICYVVNTEFLEWNLASGKFAIKVNYRKHFEDTIVEICLYNNIFSTVTTSTWGFHQNMARFYCECPIMNIRYLVEHFKKYLLDLKIFLILVNSYK